MISEREPIWYKSKNESKKEEKDREISKWDLANLHRSLDSATCEKFTSVRKRDIKKSEKAITIIPRNEHISLNKFTNPQALFKALRYEGTVESTGVTSQLKLSEYVEPILVDMDPAQEVEEEYKRKHDQMFCWKFLRTVSQVDLFKFQIKQGNMYEMFTGDVDKVAKNLQDTYCP